MNRKSQSFYGNSEYQSKMLKIFAGISLAQGGVFALLGYGLLENMKLIAEKAGIEKGHLFYESLKMEETFIYVVLLGGIGAVTVAFTWAGLKYSHEAVGAIYRMKKDIEIMTSKKDLSLLKLRRNDYFREFEYSFNQMVYAVKPHAQVLQKNSDDESVEVGAEEYKKQA